MNQTLTLAAPAKINLTLDVTGRRPDGYHTVRMIMQTVSLHDDVTVVRTAHGVTLRCDLPGLSSGADNLATRAARLFFAQVCDGGAAITLCKRIPMAAGLAGGSADAAAVLRALNRLYQTGLETKQLCSLGLRLGADVPYCLRGGTMLAEGIGEQLSPLPSAPPCHVVLVKPSFDVSTALIYSKMNGGDLPRHPDTARVIRALREGSLPDLCRHLYNVMEPVTGGIHPEIATIRTLLLANGAEGAAMSGSGPTVFGLFARRETAAQAAAVLKKQFAQTYLAQICG